MKHPNFMLSIAYKEAQRNLSQKLTKWDKAEEVGKFILSHDLDVGEKRVKRTERTLTENVDRIFRACEYLGIPRIFIGEHEFIGADHIFAYGQYAIWRLVELLNGYEFRSDGVGLHAGVANADQHKVQNVGWFVPEAYFNTAWEVESRELISFLPFAHNAKETELLIKLAR